MLFPNELSPLMEEQSPVNCEGGEVRIRAGWPAHLENLIWDQTEKQEPVG
jgi:hypothetical protein